MIPFDIQLILNQLVYDSKNPLLFSSGFFLYFFILFYSLYYLFRNSYKSRAVILSLFSLYFFYKASGSFVVLVLISAIIDFVLSNLIFRQKIFLYKKLLLSLSVVFNLGILFYFKYTNFFIELINTLGTSHFQFLNLILPIGISFYTFENLSYTIDVYKGEIKPEKNIVNYLLFLSFFPKLVMGPIVRAKDFIPQLKKKYFVSQYDFSKGFYLILTGLIKKLIISDYITLNLVDYVFDGPSLHNGFECLIALYGYAIVIYCDFSGYSDIAIGIAKWLGITIPTNFMSPYQSKSIKEFWKRWHISLSSWLQDYLYIFTFGGNRKGKFRTNLNLLLTMILGGFWHGASWNFIIWGALHGLGLIVHKAFSNLNVFKTEKAILIKTGNIISLIITFHFVLFCWIFFRTSDINISWQFISKIFYDFSLIGFDEFYNNYTGVIFMILLGMFLHFIPETIGEWIIEKQKKFNVIYFVLLFLVFLVLYSFFKSAEPIMPIYLQF
jgi:D-alanyl-lipoteichoic acid acyltransferase DltB (MBOAT superfamily)